MIFLSELFNTVMMKLQQERSNIPLLKKEENVVFLEKLFISILSNPITRKSILRLRSLDEITFFHSFDVFVLGSIFMKKMNYSNIPRFAKGCLLHDIGKIDIPIDILMKTSSLTKCEKKIMEDHTIFGYNRLIEFESQFIADMAKFHHEKFNGSGYPNGINLNELEPENQLLTFIDHFSALTMERPYKVAFDFSTAFRYMEENLGSEHFQLFINSFKKIFIYNSEIENNHLK